MFKEGNTFGHGRPLGSKDEKWKSLQTLWDELLKLFPKLPDNKKADIYLTMIKLHAERVLAQLPNTPDDSVSNASNLLAQLKELENGVKQFENNRTSSSNPNSVDARPVDIQAETNPAPHQSDLGKE